MKKASKFVLISTLAAMALSGSVMASDVKVDKYEVKIPERSYYKYNGAYKKNFPNGFELGMGSGMTFKGVNKDGSVDFYVIGDRGPNANAPLVFNDATGTVSPSKFFPAPNYTPRYGTLRVNKDGANVIHVVAMKGQDGNYISGRPISAGKIGSTKEVPVSDWMSILKPDDNGLDTEGIAIDPKDGNYWICDEYGPFIAKIDRKKGQIVEKYGPGMGLPEIIKHRFPNRGFEGIATTPNGKVYAAVQSILDLGMGSKEKSIFTRIVELDPETGKTRQFAYPLDTHVWKKTADAKIGDLHAINDHEFLIIEQGKDKHKKMYNVVYKINIADATDITGVMINGKLPEKAKDYEFHQHGIKLIEKALVVDLKKYGWEPSKAEGVTMVDDKTIAVISDNDFGMKAKTINPATKGGKAVKKATSYEVDTKRNVYYNGNKVNTKFEIIPNNEKASFWMIHLPKSIHNYN